MRRFFAIHGIALPFLFLQIYTLGRLSGVVCHMSSSFERLRMLRTIAKDDSQQQLCYNPQIKHHLRLWNNWAPGAVGNDPCLDIPFLKVVYPSGSIRSKAAIILMPGGGYHQLNNFKEQGPVARYFADNFGVTTFILRYRRARSDGTYRYPVPMWDAQRAVRYVRSNAAQFNINPNYIGVFGFSSGGHLAATIALHSDQNFGLTNQDSLDRTNAQVAFLGLGYPVISMSAKNFATSDARTYLLRGYTGDQLAQLRKFLSANRNVHSNSPPTFIFASYDDQRIDPENSLLFIKALREAGVPYESHMFQHGKHGAGLAEDNPEEGVWPKLFGQWLSRMRFTSNS